MGLGKVIHIVGARPQFIKLAPVRKAFASLGISDEVIHTGQHYDYEMSSLLFDGLALESPEYNLGVGSGPHGKQTGKMLAEIEHVLLGEKPSLVLVYGDTNSTLAGALASVKLKIPVGHVEAGLRSFNRYMPEEINRILTDHMSEYLFCPTERAVKLLENEGLEGVFTGDVMLDALNMFSYKGSMCPYKDPFVLVTIHREENTDDNERFRAIWAGINMIARDIHVVFPAHPRTKNLYKDMLFQPEDNLDVIAPVGYLEMIGMIRHAECIITDSGGVQKEAFLLKTPCVTVRNATEWPETVNAGWNCLTDASPSSIHSALWSMVNTELTDVPNPFGDGSASYHIARFIIEHCI